MRWVLTRTIGDSCTFSCEVVDCIEFDGTAEELAFELELWWEENFMKPGETPQFNGTEIEPHDLAYRDRIGNYHFDKPIIQTLDEWFESKKRK